jgi:hypothetical protein
MARRAQSSQTISFFQLHDWGFLCSGLSHSGKVRGTARSLLQRGEPQRIYLALLANIRL